MSSVISSTGRRPALLIAGILLIATTLRVVFTGAAPLLDAIRSDYGLTTAQTGLLTTLPLLAFGLVSPLAPSAAADPRAAAADSRADGAADGSGAGLRFHHRLHHHV